MADDATTIDSFLRAVARVPEADPEGATDDYVDRVEIARGGMGRIVAARDRRLERTVALKLLRTQSPGLRARFERETKLTARLQHPSIVSIHEAGRSAAGEPFYAMKLVPGQAFDRVVAAATTLDQRLALLPHVLAVADALAYAHRERVIHRDLKPQNVLVGEFGETVVIDWGLAKDLGAAELAPEDADDGDPTATRAGDVMGTPAYMPPEQAAGEPVDERADVYAIGALLYHALAGGAPYHGKSSADVLAAVKSEPPQPLGDRQPGLAPDLLAIVARAMAREPAARYRTARELAADLRRFQAGQLVGAHRYSSVQLFGRWLRRHRAAVSVAAVAAVVLIAGGVISVQRILRSERHAQAAQRVAEVQRADAEELMDFMLFDLRDKLRPVGQLSLLSAVAEKARDHYLERPPGHDPDARRKQATALTNLGDVLREEGDTPGALLEHRAALALRQAMAVETPHDGLTQYNLILSHQKISDLLRSQGNAVDAIAEIRTAVIVAEALSAQDPSNPHGQKALSTSHEKLGILLREQGDVAGGLAELRAALAIAERLAVADPADAARQRDVALTHEKVGLLLQTQGDAAGALGEFRADLAITEALLGKDPSDATLMHDAALGHEHVGEELDDPAAALVELRKALALSEQLAALDPANATWQRSLPGVHEKIGARLLAQGDDAAALVEARAVVTVAEALVAADPSDARDQQSLSIGHERVGDVLEVRHDHAGALVEYRAALAIDVALAAQDPGSTILQRDLATGHAKVGGVLLAQADRAAALVELRAALAIVEPLAAANPDNAEYPRTLAALREQIAAASAP